jgi:hypothetical protein
MWIELINLVQDRNKWSVAVKDGNEPCGLMKGGRFLDRLNILIALHEGPCSSLLF